MVSKRGLKCDKVLSLHLGACKIPLHLAINNNQNFDVVSDSLDLKTA